MECTLCSHDKTHKHRKTSKGSQRYYCPNCRQTYTETFDTIYYRRQGKPEKIRTVLQAHSEGILEEITIYLWCLSRAFAG